MDKRKLGMALAFVGAALIVVGVLQHDWWAGDVGDGVTISIGVSSVVGCYDGTCETKPLSDIPDGSSSGWITVGSVLFYVGLVAGAVLVLVGGLAAANKRPYWPIAPTTLGFLLSAAVIILGVLFVLLKPPGLHDTGLQAGMSLFVLTGGAIAGLMGSLLSAQSMSATVDDDWA